MYMPSYYSNDLHRGVAQFALEAGWSLNTSMYRSGELPIRRWDGVIGSFIGRNDFYEQVVRPQGIPAVSLTETDAMPCVLPDNAASRRIADKLGMHEEGTIKRDNQSHVRFVIRNPDPSPTVDPRFSLECPPYDW